jgi:spectinomycin phosphotransferase
MLAGLKARTAYHTAAESSPFAGPHVLHLPRAPPRRLPSCASHPLISPLRRYARVRAGYGLAASELTFLPLGHDAAAWVYRVGTADGSAYFLKVRLGVTNQAGLRVPRYLQDQGGAHVVAPLPTFWGTLWTPAAEYVLILYPFVAGVTGMQRGMSTRQWTDYGALLRQIHATGIPPDLARIMRRESFIPAGGSLARQLDAHIGRRSFEEPASDALASAWQAQRGAIRLLLDRAEELGRRLAQRARPLVLCHADIHTNNVLLDTNQQVWIVDWDDTMLAPCERDLMYVIGGIVAGVVGPLEEALFFEGYGPVTVDPLALAYYRYARAVEDISANAEQVFYRPDLGSDTKREAVDRFVRLFAPGYIIERAFASDDGPA